MATTKQLTPQNCGHITPNPSLSAWLLMILLSNMWAATTPDTFWLPPTRLQNQLLNWDAWDLLLVNATLLVLS